MGGYPSDLIGSILTFALAGFAVVAIPVLPFVLFYGLFAGLRRFGLRGSPTYWAIAAYVLCLSITVAAPRLVLPVGARIWLSEFHVLFPALRRSGFGERDVSRLVDAMGTGSPHNVQVEAQRVLIEMGAPVVPAMIEALQSSDEGIRGGAIVVLAPIGSASRAAIPPVIDLLGRESVEQVQIYSLGFLIRAIEWGEPLDWLTDARVVAGNYLTRPGNTPGYAATLIGAMKASGAPALSALRRTVEAHRAEPNDAFVLRKAFFAIQAICSSLGDAGNDHIECRALSEMAEDKARRAAEKP